MKRIILHWTAGTYNISAHEKECYHFIVNSKGEVIPGIFKPEDNLNCADGKYAQHTGGGNTGSIGIAMGGMYVPNGIPVKSSKYLLTKTQCERFFNLIAELCKKYNIPISADNVMTHFEFGRKHPNTSSAGKIDINYLPPYPEIRQSEVGDFIRNKAVWYFNKGSK